MPELFFSLPVMFTYVPYSTCTIHTIFSSVRALKIQFLVELQYVEVYCGGRDTYFNSNINTPSVVRTYVRNVQTFFERCS